MVVNQFLASWKQSRLNYLAQMAKEKEDFINFSEGAAWVVVN
jgi:hypothetical protein